MPKPSYGDSLGPISAGAGIVTKLSPRSVAGTVARLRAAVAEKNLKLFAVIDHSGEAEAVGLQLRETELVVFGSPRAGTPVMQAAPLAALELPLKVLVWLMGIRPSQLHRARRARGRYGFSDELAAGLAGIDAVTDAVVGE